MSVTAIVAHSWLQKRLQNCSICQTWVFFCAGWSPEVRQNFFFFFLHVVYFIVLILRNTWCCCLPLTCVYSLYWISGVCFALSKYWNGKRKGNYSMNQHCILSIHFSSSLKHTKSSNKFRVSGPSSHLCFAFFLLCLSLIYNSYWLLIKSLSMNSSGPLMNENSCTYNWHQIYKLIHSI